MKIEYTPKNFSEAHLDVIEKADAIARDYARQGYDLTLRQMYYQFVARGLMENRDQNYKRLGGILNDARLAGLFDWRYMVDRTRNIAGGDAGDNDPATWLQSVASMYRTSLWEGQTTRVEVWVEKEALAGVVERAAGAFRAAYFSCRGYVSQSELWGASQRLERYIEAGAEEIVVLYLGDHDPSGIDMTRDVTDRLALFMEGDGYDSGVVEVRRIALNMDQVRQYNPPPNPAKLTDSRVRGYIQEFGRQSWELDALDPATLNALITANIEEIVDPDPWNERTTIERDERARIVAVAKKWDQLDITQEDLDQALAEDES